MTKKVAIVQSNYIPWKGYFDIINTVDEFVLFDTVQYTKRDWRNRNRIKTPNGVRWLSIPIRVKERFPFPIYEAQVVDHHWVKEHWKTLQQTYTRAPHFSMYEEAVEAMYDAVQDETHLSKINYHFLRGICDLLDITTPLIWSMDLPDHDGKSDRLLTICQQLNADVYLSGPSAKGYLNEDLFQKAGIKVEWMDYDDYPEYPQIYPPFEHSVTVLDLLFCTGNEAKRYMKSFR